MEQSGQVRLFDLLKKASGITNNADLSRIEVVRKNSISQGGGEIKALVNLLDLINTGNQKLNLILQDGDYVVVPKALYQLKNRLLQLIKLI